MIENQTQQDDLRPYRTWGLTLLQLMATIAVVSLAASVLLKCVLH